MVHTQNLRSRQQVVFAGLAPSCQQIWNKLLTTYNNLVVVQQSCYNHDITILQPCVVNLVTFLLYHDCIRLVKTKSDNAIKLVKSCQQLVPNLLQQTRNKLCEHNLLTTCEQICITTCLQQRFYACCNVTFNTPTKGLLEGL